MFSVRKWASFAVPMALLVQANGQEKIAAGEPATTSRDISYHRSDIPPIATEIRYTTMIVLVDEKIVAVTCGDKDNWTVEHAANVVFVKPGKQGARTNINIVTEAGNFYSYSVREVSQEPGAHADLKIFAKAADQQMIEAQKRAPLFVSAEEARADKERAAAAEQREQETKKKAATTAQETVAGSLRHDYTWDENKKTKAFGVDAIYSLNGWTYIEAHPQEAPALYEVKDGKDSLIQFELQDGKYCVKKILDEGYLAIGKAKLSFHRNKSAA